MVLTFSLLDPQTPTDVHDVRSTSGDLRPWFTSDSDMTYMFLAIFIPNLLISFVTLLVPFGLDAFKLVIRYPAVVLMPVFTPFTFSKLKEI